MRDKRTAYHEAGHAVVAARLGLVVGKVTIIPSEDLAGSCEFNGFYPGGTIGTACSHLVATLAGGFAEARFRGYTTPDEYEWETSGDREQFASYFGKLMLFQGQDLSPEKVKRSLVLEMESLIKENWDKIEQLADHLMAVGTIDGYELPRKFRY
jgi:ATP-dependent Zn protease